MKRNSGIGPHLCLDLIRVRLTEFILLTRGMGSPRHSFLYMRLSTFQSKDFSVVCGSLVAR